MLCLSVPGGCREVMQEIESSQNRELVLISESSSERIEPGYKIPFEALCWRHFLPTRQLQRLKSTLVSGVCRDVFECIGQLVTAIEFREKLGRAVMVE